MKRVICVVKAPHVYVLRVDSMTAAILHAWRCLDLPLDSSGEGLRVADVKPHGVRLTRRLTSGAQESVYIFTSGVRYEKGDQGAEERSEKCGGKKRKREEVGR